MDLGKYWRDVRAEQEKLPRRQVYYLVSIDNPDKGITEGRVMDLTDPKQVARRLVERTHILATDQQIALHQAQQKQQVEDLADIELARKGQLAMPKELQTLVRLATEAQTKANLAAQPQHEEPAAPPPPKPSTTPKEK